METSKLRISEEELIEAVLRYSKLYDPADKYYDYFCAKKTLWRKSQQ
jgi:hypothetical protein